MLRLLARLIASLFLLGIGWLAFLALYNSFWPNSMIAWIFFLGSIAAMIFTLWALKRLWSSRRRDTEWATDGPGFVESQPPNISPRPVAPSSRPFDEEGFLAYLKSRNLIDANLSPEHLAALRREYSDSLG